MSTAGVRIDGGKSPSGSSSRLAHSWSKLKQVSSRHGMVSPRSTPSPSHSSSATSVRESFDTELGVLKVSERGGEGESPRLRGLFSERTGAVSDLVLGGNEAGEEHEGFGRTSTAVALRGKGSLKDNAAARAEV